NLLAASALSNRKFRVISRSDSTLRGHYPAEVMALKEGLQMKEVKQVIMPFFLEGGRITVNDIHYVKEGGQLVPVSETPFARDASFGYKNADLKQWIQEKSKGEIESKDVCSISLYDLREKGPLKTAEKIFNTDTTAFVVNAVTTRDAEVAALAFLLAEEKGAVLLYRTAATIVQTLAGLRPRPLLTKGELDLPPGGGSLTIVGSYVPKSTDQLAYITQNQEVSSIHVEVEKVLSEKSNDYLLQQYTREVESCLLKGRDVVIYTSRELVTGNSARESLDIVAKISEFVVKIVKNISLRPRFIIAKGGITSSDIATKALGMKKAMVLGQLLPGVPVWRLDKESRFAGMVYVVFPGNVGEKESLSRALSILK
ncbi:MAG: hypothetical protein OEY51_08270, partial [Cyclobacteriaceae bacterium]|nr:hypothetical protein [Cyclobacteriaceae bacterium]